MRHRSKHESGSSYKLGIVDT